LPLYGGTTTLAIRVFDPARGTAVPALVGGKTLQFTRHRGPEGKDPNHVRRGKGIRFCRGEEVPDHPRGKDPGGPLKAEGPCPPREDRSSP